MKIKISYQGYPWARSQQYVRKGKADAFFTHPTAKRRIYIDVGKEPVLVITTHLFTYAHNLRMEELKKIQSIQDLVNFKIIGKIGNGIEKKIYSGMDVHWVRTLEQKFSLLSNGGGDVISFNLAGADFMKKKLGLKDEIVELPFTLGKKDFTLCISKNSAYNHILPDFDKAIRAMKKDGAMEKIFDKYR